MKGCEKEQLSKNENSESNRKKFHKFRDNKVTKTPKHLKRKRHNNRDDSYIKKLLRSIKRRNKSANISPTIQGSLNRCQLLKKRALTNKKKLQTTILQMSSNKKSQKTTKNKVKSNAKHQLFKSSIEEGEIVDCSDDDENDCMVVEPTLEDITIDVDDYPSTSQFGAALARSTPNAKTFYEDHRGNATLKLNHSRANEKSKPKYNANVQTLGRDKSTNHDVIVIDDFIILSETTMTNTVDDNDSIISLDNSNENTFIPLKSEDVPNPIVIVDETPKKRKQNHSFFTASEQKALKNYNTNCYNPNANEEKGKTKKRTVIIDGSNVAYSHGLTKHYSVEGLKICIDFFEKLGHDTKAVVPSFRRNAFKSSNGELLDELHKNGKIVFTPCKNLPGLQSISYDDRFIVQLACDLDAAIISNDNYRDLLNENVAFKKIIENRVVGYTFFNDIFVLPKDPYGRWGPSLDSILNRS